MPGYCIKSFTGNGKVRATKEDKATTTMEKSFFTRVNLLPLSFKDGHSCAAEV
ncbi:hypothetical protein NC652_027574 [Populus alba x Populus x berolinensis]|nr:hypothetical protein NC652_027574 [Populus alba x Populus x berolinensis]